MKNKPKKATVTDVTDAQFKQLSAAVDKLRDAFYAEIDKLAVEAREVLLPYFREHGLGFEAKHGTYYFSGVDRRGHVWETTGEDTARLPRNVRKLLNLGVTANDYLGDHVADIKRGK